MRTVRLLIVEDSPSYLHLIERAFAGHKSEICWDLMVAMDGDKALKLLFGSEIPTVPLPHLILLDWNLPKVSGNEVLRRIKDDPRLRRIPVLIFSSSEAHRDIEAAYDGHANGYLTKPDSIALMEDTVETIGHFWGALSQLPTTAR